MADAVKHAELIGDLMPLDDVDVLAHYGRQGMKWYHHIFGVYQSSARYAKRAGKAMKKAIKQHVADKKKNHISTAERKRALKEYNEKHGTKYKMEDVTFKRGTKTFSSKGKALTSKTKAEVKEGSNRAHKARSQYKPVEEMTNKDIDEFFNRQQHVDRYNAYVRNATMTRGQKAAEWTSKVAKRSLEQAIDDAIKSTIKDMTKATQQGKQKKNKEALQKQMTQAVADGIAEYYKKQNKNNK